MGDKCIEVAVRIRRLTANEIRENSTRCITANNRTIRIQKGTQRNCEFKEFSFDYVFDEGIRPEQIYNSAVKGMLDCIFEGRSSTIFVYGADGTGKSYSLGTNYTLNKPMPSGIIPRVIQDLFDRMEVATRRGITCKITISLIKLHNTKIYDLLEDTTPEVELRENERRVNFIGLTEKSVNSLDEFLDYLSDGLERSISSNGHHNRSHEILTVTLSQENNSGMVKMGRFNFVDLASSQSQSDAKDNETIMINQDLLALSKVFVALSKNSTFIGYREGKLTRILQDSLTAEAKILIIACVSPALQKIRESYSTLKYADHPKKNQRIIHQVQRILRSNVADINQLIAFNKDTMKCTVMHTIKKRLKDLEVKLEKLRENQTGTSSGNSRDSDEVKEIVFENHPDTIEIPEREAVPSSNDERIPEIIENPAEPEEIETTPISIEEYRRMKNELEEYKRLYTELSRDKEVITPKTSKPRSPAGFLAVEVDDDFSYSSDESIESDDSDWADTLSPKTFEEVHFLTVPQEPGRRTRSRSA